LGDAVQGRVLEVGAGIGNITRWLALRADQLVAVEPDPVMSQEIARFRLANVEVLSLPLEAIVDGIESFDSAALVNVLEQFPE
jgi:16S rRNA A1518/A1519 N6-dimethyltransferase RsmA/KsgA/DIM1 with predicted DNA glycosylase/AP lyase activity